MGGPRNHYGILIHGGKPCAQEVASSRSGRAPLHEANMGPQQGGGGMAIQVQSAASRAVTVPFVALLIGIAILYAVATAGDRGLWLDELYTFAASDPGQSLALLLRTQMSLDTNPPLYYAAAHGWTLLFGASEIAYRSLSLLFAVLTLP